MARYKPGQSGNPAGRPKGAKDRGTVAVLEIIEAAHKSLVEKKQDLTFQAEKDPKWFYEKIWSRIIPNNIKLDMRKDFKIIVTKDE